MFVKLAHNDEAMTIGWRILMNTPGIILSMRRVANTRHLCECSYMNISSSVHIRVQSIALCSSLFRNKILRALWAWESTCACTTSYVTSLPSRSFILCPFAQLGAGQLLPRSIIFSPSLLHAHSCLAPIFF